MSPIEAVQQLAAVLAKMAPPFSEDDVYAALEAAGVPAAEADRAYKFGQLACGRQFLDGLGVTFSNDYVCFNSNGSVVETGKVNEEKYFVAAMQYATADKIGAQSFSHFALMSADVHAVNNALNSGSNPKDLITAPGFLFLESPTEAGWANAQRIMARYVAKMRAVTPSRKPWWKFW